MKIIRKFCGLLTAKCYFCKKSATASHQFINKANDIALAGMDNNLFVSTYMITLPDTKQLEDFIIKELRKEEI